MKFLTKPFIILLVSLGCQPNQEVRLVQNDEERLIQQHVMAVLWFQQSAEMKASYLQSYRYARILLDTKLEARSTDRPVGVVLDIDETVLDNSPNAAHLIKTGKTFTFDKWKLWSDQARAKALPGALEFVNYAMSQGVEVFYISNRMDVELTATIKNLNTLNFPNADSTHVLLKTETSDKTIRRNAVSSQVEVLVYLGDNLRDYSEVYGNRGEDMGIGVVMDNKEDLLNNFVIFPNPTYGEWEKPVFGGDMGIPDSVKLARRIGVLED